MSNEAVDLKFELEHVPTEDLWKELRGRFASCVMVHERLNPKSGGPRVLDCWNWAVSETQVLGMLELHVVRIKAAIVRCDTCEFRGEDED